MNRLPDVIRFRPAIAAGALLVLLGWCIRTSHAQVESPLPSIIGIQTQIRTGIAYGLIADGSATESNVGFTRPAKSLFSFDKVQHVTFGFLFTVGYQYAFVNKLERTERQALPLSIAGTAAVGIGKEVYDWRFRSKHEFGGGDLVADAVGILLAVGLILI